MAGGFLGLPQPWAASPLANLTAMTEQGAGQGAPSPPPAPAPAAAAPADPATTGSIPAPAGGGSSRGLGDMLGDAISGRGIMGARPGDDAVDPSTGATVGQARQVSMQSMMGMGLTLLAAGMRQTDDSRAAILSNAPKMLAGGAGDLNNFAKMRLEMAQARLKEREASNADERAKRWGALMGGSGAAAGVAPTAAPVASPEALPGTIAPVAPVAAPGAAPAPAVAAPTAPAGGSSVMDGVSPGTRAILGALGPEKGMEKLLDIRRGLDEQETIGEPRTDSATGKVVADKMKNGRKVGLVVIGDQAEFAGPASVDPETGRKGRDILRGGVPIRNENLGDVPKPLEIETADDGRKFQVRKNAAGQVVERTAIPEAREDATTAARAKAYVDMEGEIRKGATGGRSMMKLLGEFQGAIDDPNVYFGAGADKVNGAKSIAKALGMDVAGVDNANLAQKVQNQLALQVRNPEGGFGGMPGSTSDRDITFLLSSVPSLMSTREGAQLIKNTFAEMAQRNLDIDKMRRDYIRTHKKLDGGFEDMVADKYDQPLLDENARGLIERAQRQSTPAPAAPAGPAGAPSGITPEQARAELARRRAAAGK